MKSRRQVRDNMKVMTKESFKERIQDVEGG